MRPFNLPLSSAASSRGRDWALPLVLVLSVLLQFSWLARVQVWGAHFDLPLLCVLSVGLLRGPRVGAGYGLAAGLLCGFFAGSDVGTWGLSRLLIGGACGLFEERLQADHPFAPMLCAFAAVLASRLLFYVMAPGNFRFVTPFAFGAQLGGAWLMSVLAAPFVHRFLRVIVVRPQRGLFGSSSRI